MKKRIGIFSIIFVVLTLTSCGNNEPIEPLDASSSVNSAQAQKPAQIVDGELQSLKWGSAITKDGYYLMDLLRILIIPRISCTLISRASRRFIVCFRKLYPHRARM